MTENLTFHKSIKKEEYICAFKADSYKLHETFSKRNYQEAGENMMKFLKDNLSEESLKEPSYLLKSTFQTRGIENPKEEELVLIKNSLEKFIQDNKFNIKLEVKN